MKKIVHTSPLGPTYNGPPTLFDLCTWNPDLCGRMSRRVGRPVHTVEELYRLRHTSTSELIRTSNPTWGSVGGSYTYGKPTHATQRQFTHVASECLAGTPPTRSSGGLLRLRFGLIEKQASGFLT
ncbi:hypothetical protein PIB30_001518 [Stylosanthes scabra]|uniref:Uncharacterized protein n=1 Tax=Stylosanthes scabra TaxID=79078 RepID=A0ABU6R322_9FABA|nr:hypothetical protein [Stylosanthes scabra]